MDILKSKDNLDNTSNKKGSIRKKINNVLFYALTILAVGYIYRNAPEDTVKTQFARYLTNEGLSILCMSQEEYFAQAYNVTNKEYTIVRDTSIVMGDVQKIVASGIFDKDTFEYVTLLSSAELNRLPFLDKDTVEVKSRGATPYRD